MAWLEAGFGAKDAGQWMPGPVAWLRQIHSDRCVVTEGAEGCLGEGDALITRTPGNFLAVRTADCIPILIADERRRVVAAVHAGWRGTAARIAARTVETMAERFSCAPADLRVAIGPGVCRKCYTVGPEVARQFQAVFPERTDMERETTLDLPEANRRQLQSAGVLPERIVTGAPCSFCNRQEFHSFRRDGKQAGRMYSAIRVRT